MRTAVIKRKTAETDITLTLILDGMGNFRGTSGIGFFDHMLTAWCRHSKFDVDLNVHGDLEVDGHHTVEDVGLCLGQAFFEALGDKRGIYRFGSAFVPMDESLARAVADISGRAYFLYDALLTGSRLGEFDLELVSEFFRAFTQEARLTLHLKLCYGGNNHHKVEAMFKACARALAEAVAADPREGGIPSSKGVL
ncbi:imidazoleglycerol-phosphate dehydratase HisB [Metallumcola ferriviriculae]|uniref:Imidazoleglycerol-phosphate dehydratase n=1 Tax=Metallumcola ferriviriculae TaxID=3039180 RepID=A0AAU0USX0_9FIRM|nr:imidazoleglycerol-phosphate dehydratase HisB [Desulfitibacteraceae bacterium MK1]